ncbi:hypothetical protein V8G54_035539 [Vigna mungo]|uniref:Protein kinase domain-containing protein n=1 Tax=Vigna mungo TaxID=3915 RepID=A0AAQ3RFS4_VIGMU
MEDTALFGKYELGCVIGCGAFAKVHYARNMQMGQSVTVKIINKKKINRTGIASNVKREISIISRLHHPNIVRLHEVLATKNNFLHDGLRVARGRALLEDLEESLLGGSQP